MKSRPTPSGPGSASCVCPGKCAAASSTRARTSGSAPSSHATPTETSSSVSSSAGAKPGARSAIARSHVATSRAIGPAWSKLGASGKQPSSETSPKVGLKPTTPQQAAGIRIDPPESVPSATSAAPSASAAALPPLEPPATRPGKRGFGTTPKCGFSEVTP